MKNLFLVFTFCFAAISFAEDTSFKDDSNELCDPIVWESMKLFRVADFVERYGEELLLYIRCGEIKNTLLQLASSSTEQRKDVLERLLVMGFDPYDENAKGENCFQTASSTNRDFLSERYGGVETEDRDNSSNNSSVLRKGGFLFGPRETGPGIYLSIETHQPFDEGTNLGVGVGLGLELGRQRIELSFAEIAGEVEPVGGEGENAAFDRKTLLYSSYFDLWDRGGEVPVAMYLGTGMGYRWINVEGADGGRWTVDDSLEDGSFYWNLAAGLDYSPLPGLEVGTKWIFTEGINVRTDDKHFKKYFQEGFQDRKHRGRVDFNVKIFL